MSKISDFYNAGDIKYFRGIHKQKQLAMGKEYVSYTQFRKRLEMGMNLKEAIYTPCDLSQRRRNQSKTPISDNIRRRDILRHENIQILDLDEMIAIQRAKQELQQQHPTQPKPRFRDRFISFFKRGQKRK